ncbi:MAG: phage tail protein [Motiliproteus sp.]
MSSKLQLISASLAAQFELLGINAENFESFQEGGELQPGGGNETEQGWHQADWKYRAVLAFERIPASSAGLLLALVQAWLDENDPDRSDHELGNPQGQIDLDDNNKFADVELTLDFVDPIYLVQDDSGPIVWNGQQFNFGDYDLWIAEQGGVTHDADQQ